MLAEFDSCDSVMMQKIIKKEILYLKNDMLDRNILNTFEKKQIKIISGKINRLERILALFDQRIRIENAVSEG